MKWWRQDIVCAIAACAISAACSEGQIATHAVKKAQTPTNEELGIKKGGAYKIGNPYQINGVWYYPAEDPNYDQTGIGSWYGEQFHGKATANGEIYDMNDLTAAHQTLPLTTQVRVTNLENGRSIVVRINDRGPFVNGRLIDMSRRGAQLLGYDKQGTARVRVQAINDAGPGGTQIAQASGGEKPPISAAPRKEVTAAPLSPPAGAKGQTPPPAAAPQPPPPSALAILGSDVPQVNLSAQPVRQEAVKPTSIWVQAGAFSQYDNANRLKARLSTVGPTKVTQVNVRGTDLFRVRIGPVETVEQADQILAAIIAGGQTDARIIVE